MVALARRQPGKGQCAAREGARARRQGRRRARPRGGGFYAGYFRDLDGNKLNALQDGLIHGRREARDASACVASESTARHGWRDRAAPGMEYVTASSGSARSGERSHRLRSKHQSMPQRVNPCVIWSAASGGGRRPRAVASDAAPRLPCDAHSPDYRFFSCSTMSPLNDRSRSSGPPPLIVAVHLWPTSVPRRRFAAFDHHVEVRVDRAVVGRQGQIGAVAFG